MLELGEGAAAGVRCQRIRQVWRPQATSFRAVPKPTLAAAAVSAVVRDCGAEGRRCLVSLPAGMFQFCNFDLPFTDRRTIDQVIPHELAERLAFGDDPIEYDAAVVARRSDETSMMAAAISRHSLLVWLDLLEQIGLDLDAVTISGLPRALSLCRALHPEGGDLAMLQLGTGEAVLFILAGGGVRIIRPLAIKPPAAVSITPSGWPPETVQHLYREICRTLLGISVGPAQWPDLQLHVSVSAGPREELSFVNKFNDMGSIRAVAVDSVGLPVVHFPAPSYCPETETQPPPAENDDRSQSAVGRIGGLVASEPNDWRHINLVRKTAGKSVGHRFTGVSAMLAGAVLLLICGVVAFQLYDYRRLSTQNDQLSARAAAIYSETLDGRKPGRDPAAELAETMASMRLGEFAEILPQPKITAVDVLAEISARIPPTVRVSFERLVFDRRTVVIDGLTETFNDVDRIRKSLEDSSRFTGVALGSADITAGGAGVRFDLVLTL